MSETEFEATPSRATRSDSEDDQPTSAGLPEAPRATGSRAPVLAGGLVGIVGMAVGLGLGALIWAGSSGSGDDGASSPVIPAGEGDGPVADPIDPDDGSALADQLVLAGLELELAGDRAGAERLYLEALDADPRNTFALYNSGVIRQNVGDLEAAAAFYRDTLGVDPEFSSARFNLAVALRELGDTDEAISELRILIDANPDSVGALFVLGNILIGEGEIDEGGELVARAIELEPSLLAEE